MGKRTVFTNITPFPLSVSREVAIAMLHDHDEMIELNPLVIEHHPIKAPRDAPADEFLDCVWQEMTDRISYLPGGAIKGNVTYRACFHDLPNGLQTHVYAPMGLDIREKWSVCGTLPGEPDEPRELGIDVPRKGLYLREDGEIKCNVLMTGFVRKNLDNAHKVLVERILKKAQRVQQHVFMHSDGSQQGRSPLLENGSVNRMSIFQTGSHMEKSSFVRTPTLSSVNSPRQSLVSASSSQQNLTRQPWQQQQQQQYPIEDNSSPTSIYSANTNGGTYLPYQSQSLSHQTTHGEATQNTQARQVYSAYQQPQYAQERERGHVDDGLDMSRDPEVHDIHPAYRQEYMMNRSSSGGVGRLLSRSDTVLPAYHVLEHQRGQYYQDDLAKRPHGRHIVAELEGEGHQTSDLSVEGLSKTFLSEMDGGVVPSHYLKDGPDERSTKSKDVTLQEMSARPEPAHPPDNTKGDAMITSGLPEQKMDRFYLPDLDAEIESIRAYGQESFRTGTAKNQDRFRTVSAISGAESTNARLSPEEARRMSMVSGVSPLMPQGRFRNKDLGRRKSSHSSGGWGEESVSQA